MTRRYTRVLSDGLWSKMKAESVWKNTHLALEKLAELLKGIGGW
jgi:hypothetical protein